MTTTELKAKTTQLKEKATDFMRGDLTLTKLDFLLIGAICLFAGICIGLLAAPLTHGVTIGSNNGNSYGSNNNTTAITPKEEDEL